MAVHTPVTPGTNTPPRSHPFGSLKAAPYRWVPGNKTQPVSRPRDAQAPREASRQDSGQPWALEWLNVAHGRGLQAGEGGLGKGGRLTGRGETDGGGSMVRFVGCRERLSEGDPEEAPRSHSSGGGRRAQWLLMSTLREPCCPPTSARTTARRPCQPSPHC